jgi:RimJ/RimL family protein N-acetyltransferase
MGFGYWAVEEKASGEFIGELGFGEFMRDITPSIEGSLEAGWVLSPRYHGQGYAREALLQALDWVARNFPLRRVTCLIDPANEASLRLATSAGFKAEDHNSLEGAQTIVFSLLGSTANIDLHDGD